MVPIKNVEEIRKGLTPDHQPKTIFWAESEESFDVYSVRVVNEEMVDTLDPHLSDSHDIDPDLYLDLPSEPSLENEDRGFQHYFVDKDGLVSETDPSPTLDEESAWIAMAEHFSSPEQQFHSLNLL